MKTYITKISVVCLILLFHLKVFAQDEVYAYRGGIADGFTTETIVNNTCATPFHHYAYFGGEGDGSAIMTLENASCSTPFHHYAYFGGEADGSTTMTIENSSCATPYHQYAYFGGEADGYGSNSTNNVCPINPPVADFIADKTDVCTMQSVQFTDTSTNMPTGWNWTFEGGQPGTATTKTVIVTYDTPGLYQVKLVAANYNGTDTKIKVDYINVVEDCSSLGLGNISKKNIEIYPNPTTGILNLKSQSEIKTIDVYDMSGKKITSIVPNNKQVQINLEKLNAGVYILKIKSISGVETVKVIKKD